MYLDLLILSHLRTGPVHGYELKRKVSATTAFTLNNNTLYPALRRFEESGAVRKTAVQQEGRPPRHIYELTDDGREQLHDMIAELPVELAGSEEEFLSRLGLFDELDPTERHAILARRDAALSARLEHLQGLAAHTETDAEHRRWGGRVLAELIGRTQRERDWLAELGRLSGESG
ncbi:PadR family transcriptional regulator [Actinophytocola sp.]|uniref:PadR family transcriptional regulator n=1 Tax=Actinophytocola sp. TaxID=1872138 RepID=UPI002D7EE377|nr:PadR family transcriptional regulator [Actinophytocola sp.]HET9138847.1 PadR family transcriptional regulator [Actinophytocola sp.]